MVVNISDIKVILQVGEADMPIVVAVRLFLWRKNLLCFIRLVRKSLVVFSLGLLFRTSLDAWITAT
jgi:hypothetical protein